MSSGIERSKAVVATLAKSTEMTSALQRQAKETANILTELAQEASEVLGEVGNYLKKLERLEDIGQVLEDRVENLRRQLDDMYQAVALGLTAEAIVHEVFHIADNLANRTKATRSRRASESVVESYLEHVQGAVGALRKQVSYLSPQLRYVREQRENIPLVPFLTVGATDARFFRRSGSVAYGFGLFSRKLSFDDYASMFHGNDERVDTESLVLSTRLWDGLARDLLS